MTLSAVAGRTGIQPENDLPLVAKKPTVLRVYFQDISDVTGTVEWRAAGTTPWSPARYYWFLRDCSVLRGVALRCGGECVA